MNILVVGDYLSDVWHYGCVDRLNPENHAIPLVKEISPVAISPGGAGHVANAFSALGAEVSTVFGGGQSEKHRFMADDRVILRWDVEGRMTCITETNLPSDTFDAVVVSDYAKGSCVPGLPKMLAQKYPNAPIFVDTKQDPQLWIRDAACLFPNQSEFDRHSFEYAAADKVLVKRGALGAKLIGHAHAVYESPSFAKNVVGCAGAGDIVLATFVVWLLRFRNDHVAMNAAMLAAAIAVSRPTTYCPTKCEVEVAYIAEFGSLPPYKNED